MKSYTYENYLEGIFIMNIWLNKVRQITAERNGKAVKIVKLKNVAGLDRSFREAEVKKKEYLIEAEKLHNWNRTPGKLVWDKWD